MSLIEHQHNYISEISFIEKINNEYVSLYEFTYNNVLFIYGFIVMEVNKKYTIQIGIFHIKCGKIILEK